MHGFNKKELELLASLNSPAEVQEFLNSLHFNFEKDGPTIKSPLYLLRSKQAHCFEGAILGAYILSLHGYKPLVMCLRAERPDFDHVVAPFKINGLWGALSKTNHAVLRYREPVYKSIRELVMSYFHEYFTNDGKKTLLMYSDLLDLSIFEEGWETLEGDLTGIDLALDRVKYHHIFPRSQQKLFRFADKIEIKAGKIVLEKS